ncbi:MAG: histidine ammonia-lyase [Bdellovibrionales bacterium]|nr:histidine ammonia-lyase [Bdellovibrionales bacterium]
MKLGVFKLNGNDVDLDTVWKVAHRQFDRIELSDSARKKMQNSLQYISSRLKQGETMYGVNTGFGAFSSVKISPEEIVQLQKNLIRSHCCGVGPLFSEEQTRAILFLRANALARGHSGIRHEVVESLLTFLNLDILPCIPQQGSVGASGDLAPLSHLALALIGEGEVLWQGKRWPALEVINKNKISLLELQAKEGLSLINGCQVMTAVGLLAAAQTRRLVGIADLAGAMSLEALRGSRTAFDPLIFATRPHPGEAKTARNLLKILGPTSTIGKSHENCHRVQDAYSLRCMPAVHGAVKDTLKRAVETLEVEANSSTDNPLVFTEEEKILSCGNFHGEPVAFVLDFLAIAVSALASISECRIEKLINPAMSGLPAFLAPNGGLNSGLMIVQVAAAALVSENKILAHPASVDSIPTSADKEDHVSMGTIAARKLQQIITHTENVVAMELLAGAQALDFLKPDQPAGAVEAAYHFLRQYIPFAKQDRVFSRDVEVIHNLIKNSSLTQVLEQAVGELEW